MKYRLSFKRQIIIANDLLTKGVIIQIRLNFNLEELIKYKNYYNCIYGHSFFSPPVSSKFKALTYSVEADQCSGHLLAMTSFTGISMQAFFFKGCLEPAAYSWQPVQA